MQRRVQRCQVSYQVRLMTLNERCLLSQSNVDQSATITLWTTPSFAFSVGSSILYVKYGLGCIWVGGLWPQNTALEELLAIVSPKISHFSNFPSSLSNSSSDFSHIVISSYHLRNHHPQPLRPHTYTSLSTLLYTVPYIPFTFTTSLERNYIHAHILLLHIFYAESIRSTLVRISPPPPRYNILWLPNSNRTHPYRLASTQPTLLQGGRYVSYPACAQIKTLSMCFSVLALVLKLRKFLAGYWMLVDAEVGFQWNGFQLIKQILRCQNCYGDIYLPPSNITLRGSGSLLLSK